MTYLLVSAFNIFKYWNKLISRNKIRIHSEVKAVLLYIIYFFNQNMIDFHIYLFSYIYLLEMR